MHACCQIMGKRAKRTPFLNMSMPMRLCGYYVVSCGSLAAHMCCAFVFFLDCAINLSINFANWAVSDV